MSSSPGTRRRWTARATIVGATIFASITSSTAVVGLDPAEMTTAVARPAAAVAETPPISVATATDIASGTQVGEEIVIPDDECSAFLADFCVEIPVGTPEPSDEVASCSLEREHSPTGTPEIVPAGASPEVDSSSIRIEIESGLAVDADCFAGEVLEILNDSRGWGEVYGIHFDQVDDESYDLRLILASPSTTDRLCYPARTAGIYSCRKGNSVVINLMRWESGTDDYAEDLTTYRQYLINHEVGHFLGRGHEQCSGAGESAPVMMQQTKGLDGCLPNGWPTEDER